MRVFTRISVLAFLVVFAMSMNAQWQSSGGNTTTNDKVGVAAPAPGVLVSAAHVNQLREVVR